MTNKNARVIAYYLPQYHPIPENDKWWGTGFTEWTNVAKAKPLFRGHYQPHVPADLGFYDLRMPEIREQQAQMAREAGIEGFCYWNYWFGNHKKLLERPIEEVLQTGKPDFPFCVGWANHTWSNKTWEKKGTLTKDVVFMEQTYSEEDYEVYFNYLLPAFKDPRYITVDGKPLFVVFNYRDIPDPVKFIEIFRTLASKNGLMGIHIVAISINMTLGKDLDVNDTQSIYKKIFEYGFDGVNSRGYFRAEILSKGKIRKYIFSGLRKIFGISLLNRFDYRKIIDCMYTDEDSLLNVYPTIMPNWDRSPRSGKQAVIYENTTPEVFEKNVSKVIDVIKDKDVEHRIVFAQSWNEWGEGNHLEPDLKYGMGYLNVLKRLLK